MLTNIFTTEELEFLRSLPEVLQAEARLAKDSTISFRAALPDTIRQTLKDRLGVSTDSAVPFRWIRGDTRPHVDRGARSFDNTHLVYLTDGEGIFEIGEESYPITAGSGFVFSEGTRHQVTQTNGSSRLLLGPMSETGMMVGGGYNFDGATDTVYLRPGLADTELEYKINDGDWNTMYFPATIYNTNADPANNILKLYFTDNITLAGGGTYFSCGTDGIQFGNKSLNDAGGQFGITIQDTADYPGLINNGSEFTPGFSYISVYNTNVIAGGTSTLAEDAGWIGHKYFGKEATGNVIMNCVAQGNVSTGGGGIVGANAANNASGTSLSIVGCLQFGDIGQYGGGIIGAFAGQNSVATLLISQCASVGSTIDSFGGGIAGGYAGAGGSCTITKCYSVCSIGTGAGGIMGAHAASAGSVEVTYCYSSGSIGSSAGGIFGSATTENGGDATVSYCYTTGSITATSGGIVGANATGVFSVTHCYTAGSTAMAEGYIFAESDLVPLTNYSEAANDTSGWNDTNAAATLASPGNWVSTGTNQPYEINRFGASPYTFLTTTDGSTLVTQYSQTVTAGNATQGVVTPPELIAFSTVGLSEPTITIDSVTGVLQTTTATPAGEYTFTVRGALFTLYINTAVVLTVQAVPAPTPAAATATLAPRGKGFDFETLTNINMGKRFIDERLTNPNIRFNSYKDYLRYKMAMASLASR